MSSSLTGEVIQKLDPIVRRDEASIPEGFDRHIASILNLAAKVYAKRRQQSAYVLATADF